MFISRPEEGPNGGCLSGLLTTRNQDHRHIAAFDVRLPFGSCYFFEALYDGLKNLYAELRMSHLASPEPYGNFDSVSLIKEAAN